MTQGLQVHVTLINFYKLPCTIAMNKLPIALATINRAPVTHCDSHQSSDQKLNYHQSTHFLYWTAAFQDKTMKWMSLVAIGVLAVALLATNSQAQRV